MSTSTVDEEGNGKTAGIIIIGDEVLKGQILDLNTHYLCKEFYSLGVKVRKVSVIGDGLDEISKEVKKFSKKFDFVVTTGGVGPTHDDITYEGVAKAFDTKLVQNPEMVELIDKWLAHRGYSREITMRMALMPENTQLIFDPEKVHSFPIAKVNNVYVFPGVPKLLQKLFPRLRNTFKSGVFHNHVIYIAQDEMSVTPHLDEAVAKFKEHVVFGSYPVYDNLYYSTRLTMEAQSFTIVEEARSFLVSRLPPKNIVSFDSEPVLTSMEKVYAIVEDKEHPLHHPVRIAVEKIEECLKKYDPSSTCICFNGGKDCTALLHIFYAVLKKNTFHNNNIIKIPTLCIRNKDPFPEMKEFVRETKDRYNLELRIYDGPIIEGLKQALEEHNDIKVVVMGTRRSDPSGKILDYFQMTDSEWPEVMRCSPILDWTYKQVWQFLRLLTLPYCSLYDKGYTSIGSRSNTVPNESLAFTDESGKKNYRPAYTLDDCSEERTGRC